MAHEVETMFSVGETPWHGLGEVLRDPPSPEAARIAAGLAWDVTTEPVYSLAGEELSTRVVRRLSDRTILGEVGPDFTPVQNDTLFSVCDPMVRSGRARYETAGSLRAGKRVWILVRMSRDPVDIVPGDAVVPYLLVANAHDGTMSLSVRATPTRVVCANTLAVALNGRGSSVSVRHTSGVEATVRAMGVTLDRMAADFETSANAYRTLAARQCSTDALVSYVRAVFTSEKSEAAETRERSERASRRGAEMRAAGVFALGAAGGFDDSHEGEEKTSRVLPAVERLFAEGRGNALPGVRGTWWAAYNAVTEYLQYERRGTSETRLDSLTFGDGAARSRRALADALRRAA